MKIETVKFGEVEINEEFIFDFIKPILGYEHLKQYALVDHNPESPFKWLQSLEDMSVALPITVPSYFNIDYQYTLPQEDADILNAVDADKILTVTIVNVPNGKPQEATTNLAGPLVINTENKKAIQLILLNTNHPIKHKLFDDLSEAKPEESEQILIKG